MAETDFSTLELRASGEGTVLEVRARPGARTPGITGVHAGALKVALKSPPEDGKANEELIRLLADALALRRDQVALVRGAAARRKVLRLTGCTADEIRARLTRV